MVWVKDLVEKPVSLNRTTERKAQHAHALSDVIYRWHVHFWRGIPTWCALLLALHRGNN
jgi:hypothetical protein